MRVVFAAVVLCASQSQQYDTFIKKTPSTLLHYGTHKGTKLHVDKGNNEHEKLQNFCLC